MKALDILKEEPIKPTLGGVVKGGLGRISRSFTLRNTLKAASDDLAELIYQEARKSRLVVKSAKDWESIAKQVDLESAVRPHIVKIQKEFATPAERAQFVEEVYAESVKKAQIKYKEAVEATAKMNGVQQGKPKANLTTIKSKVIDALTATGIYYNVASPINEYFENVEKAAANVGKPNAKGVIVTEEHFNSYAKEELGICVTRIVALMIPFGTIGAGLRAFRNVASSIPGLGWFAPSIKNTTGQKAFYLIYAGLMNSDLSIAELTGTGGDEWYKKSPKEIITHLLLKESIIPLTHATWAEIFGFARGKGTEEGSVADIFHTGIIPYQGLKAVKDLAVQKYTEYFGKQGNRVDPNTLEPQQSTTPATPNTQTAPQATAPGDFNPADWSRTPSGFYQNKKDNSMMTPAEYEERVNRK